MQQIDMQDYIHTMCVSCVYCDRCSELLTTEENSGFTVHVRVCENALCQNVTCVQLTTPSDFLLPILWNLHFTQYASVFNAPFSALELIFS